MRAGILMGLAALFLLGCRQNSKQKNTETKTPVERWTPRYANGFHVERGPNGIDYLNIVDPWPGSEKTFRYALVPKEALPEFPKEDLTRLDGIIGVPVERIILTSTTHIPALETLDVAESLIGFPGLQYISSPVTRKRMATGEVQELGANEKLNTEMVISLEPDLVVGFGVSGPPASYSTVEASGIPVVYNGDWMEGNPLGKAEWIVFFGMLFGEFEASVKAFKEIEQAYLEARDLAASATETPTVLSGALYRDVWYLPGGKSWAASFIKDANATYLWSDTSESGSLALSLESVLEQGHQADYWIAPSQFTSYSQMEEAEVHYREFKAFRERHIYTYALSKGPADGLWYYELGPSRPDLILKDLIYWFHPGLLQDYEPFFFKPLE